MSQEIYQQQVELMLKVLPIISKAECFALKGGTAINFFMQNMPRLSVDIDLTYVPIEPRQQSLEKINNEMKRIDLDIKRTFSGISTYQSKTHDSNTIKRLFVTNDRVKIKIEPNHILRGTVKPCKVRTLCDSAQTKYAVFAEMKTLSDADLYAGKICAALDRQHPRDLFDIKILYENGGITDEIHKVFVVYLACSPRPINELLNPNFLDIESRFLNEFVGMTVQQISLIELLS